MNNDALTTLGLLVLGGYVALRVREWWLRQPHATEVHVEQVRTTQQLCTCEDCAPPFLQESPAEVQ